MLINKKAKLLALSSVLMLANGVASADSGLLDTLLQNGTITPSQYDNLAKQKADGDNVAEDKQLLETLLQNAVISQAQYENLATQAVAKQQAAKKSGSDVIVKLDSKGFRVETADKAFKFKLGGRIQADANFSANRTDFDPRPSEGVELRRARLYAAGTVWTDFDYKLQFDFAGNKVAIKDLFVKYPGFDLFDLSLGNQKQTISMELQESSNDIMFTERSLVSSLTAPLFDRAIGLRLDSSGKSWSAQLGGYGGAVSKTKGQTDGWGITGRATMAPINTSTSLVHLGVNVGYRGMTDSDNDVTFKYESSNMSDTYFTKASIADVSGATLAGFDAALMLGPFSAQGEFANTWLARDNGQGGLDFRAWYVQAAWTLTGESRSYKGSQGKFKRLKPENAFSWQRGTWGAVELATRIDGNDLNSGDIEGGEEMSLTIALNWYLNNNIRLMADYRYAFDIQDSAFTNVDGSVPDTGLHGFTLRTQLTF